MTIGYYYVIPRYAKSTNPGKKEIKEIYLYEKIIAIISASRLSHANVNRENHYKRLP
jgi:hypothetical protein